jgi:type IV pilus assembly protein PilB
VWKCAPPADKTHVDGNGHAPSPSPVAVASPEAGAGDWNGITAASVPPGRSLRRIGDVIVDLGFTDRGTVEKAVEHARETGQTTGRVLLEWGKLNSDELARAVAERYGLDYVDLNVFRPDVGAVNLISPSAAKRYEAVPIAFADERTLLVAMAHPANVLAVDDIAMMTGLEVRRAVTTAEDIQALISQQGRLDESVQEDELEDEEPIDISDLRGSAEDAPVVKLVRSVVADAVERGASDIHFDPEKGQLRVRFRIDGVVTDSTTVPRAMVPGVVSRIKIMADMNISERRLPQDGRVGLSIDGRHVDLRVLTLPIVRGESVVMRILDRSNVVIDLDRLGMLDAERDRFRAAINQPYGAVLVTGPTGSGKSTTLYAGLTEINTPDKTLITIEDPVEYELDGVKQIQVNARSGLTFPTGLRSMVRADPNVIMVGEIRDRETAQISIDAALTGHLVLSTLHTNDAPTAITRLIEMGIEPFLVASSIDCVVAQRLARTFCSCKQEAEIPAAVLRQHGFPVTKKLDGFEPGGCVRCSGTGYKGRTGLYEVMTVTDEIRRLVLERASADAIAAVAVEQGMRRLREDGFEKFKAGVTSLPEILRVTGSAAAV